MEIVEFKKEKIRELVKRSQIDVNHIINDVQSIINKVQSGGDLALEYYTSKFDKVDLKNFKVSKKEIDHSYYNLDPEIIESLKKAARNIKKFHQAQVPSEWSMEVDSGIKAGQIIRPIESAGCYIPGGRAVYPSTILMTVIPAKIAGVKRIVCCTPPQSDGTVSDAVLVAADIAGADEIYKVGGAQAIAALAYGTGSIKPVDKIVGPGNIFVTAAKKLVYGEVDIDFPAGPSEVLIIADEYSNPEYITYDLLAQAEHDPNSSCVLVTTNSSLAKNIQEMVHTNIKYMERSNIIEESLEKYGKIIITNSLEESIYFSNEYAPEHLIIMTENPESVLTEINNAGSIFLGELTPVAAGDYGSGTNHVLPTAGCAKMYSGLSTESFIKKPTVQRLSPKGLNSLKDVVVPLAEYEGLYAHSESFKRRLNKK
ncbi:MAG: histidinol dehydrogenase [Euryarchaeota archaeon]|nr:histidinol dehydrogenase [Euryarchaeota archaeon]MBU4607184.1 histidinol dehydrogenase [Euryarchaeota archaeon]MBV1730033.1 histidinol dehydrogenase [Methanobacterium sp.]MBV1753995.1 histidinol dehydrogenase [Methanobacterium sp.]